MEWLNNSGADCRCHGSRITMLQRHRAIVRLGIRSFHQSDFRRSDIDWKGPLRTLGIRKPYSLGAGLVTLAIFITFPFWFKQPLPPSYNQSRDEDLPAPVRGDTRAQIQQAIAQKSRVETKPPPKDSFETRSVDDTILAKPAGATDTFPKTSKMYGFPEPFVLFALAAAP